MKTVYIILIVLITSCSNKKLALKELKKAGYNNIKLFNYNNYACSLSDFYCIGFKAQNISKNTDSGFVYKTHKNKLKYKIVLD